MEELRSRFSRARVSLGDFDQPEMMAFVLGGLFLAGAAIGSLSLLLPHPAGFDDFELWVNIAIAAVAGLALIALRRHVRAWGLQLA